jgi:hypothetical protein
VGWSSVEILSVNVIVAPVCVRDDDPDDMGIDMDIDEDIEPDIAEDRPDHIETVLLRVAARTITLVSVMSILQNGWKQHCRVHPGAPCPNLMDPATMGAS